MGLKCVTDGRPVTIYRNEKTTQNGGKFATYSIGVASKDRDGNWVNAFIDCQFKKGIDVANKSKINISNSFYAVNEYNGNKYIKLFIMEFEIVEQGEAAKAPASPAPNDDGFMNIPDGIDTELPFN